MQIIVVILCLVAAFLAYLDFEDDTAVDYSRILVDTINLYVPLLVVAILKVTTKPRATAGTINGIFIAVMLLFTALICYGLFFFKADLAIRVMTMAGVWMTLLAGVLMGYSMKA